MNAAPERSKEVRNASELALIHAAERLFAENGIAGVSLRQINQAANQKNISAAHYHFGSREGLIQAVLEHRVLDLDLRRESYVRGAEGRSDVRYFVEALVLTLADELKPRPEGNHYLQFVQQYERYKGAQALARSLSPAGVEIYDRIEKGISYLPEAIRKLRMRYLVNIMHGVLAAAERELGAGVLSFEDIPLIACDLTDMVTAALVAPLSGATIAMLRPDAGPAA
jgi:AcrR family transcriptional regulator